MNSDLSGPDDEHDVASDVAGHGGTGSDNVADTELDDLTAVTSVDLTKLEPRLLLSPVVLRALAGVGVAVLILVWPERTDRVLARLVGLVIVGWSASSAWAALRDRPREWLRVGSGMLGMAGGVVLIAMPNRSELFVGRLLGVIVLLAVVRDVIGLFRNERRAESRSWLAARSVGLAVIGLLLVVFPVEVLATVTAIAALAWIMISLVVIVASLDPSSSGTTGYVESGELIAHWLERRPKSVEDRQALYQKVFYEAPQTQQRVVRFLTLMTFSSIIASMGVITESTAVVIGAMLIAPLMTPLMGMAMSLVMGWPNRLTRSTVLAAAGILLAIGIGLLLGLIVPTIIDTTSNSQIISRDSPTTLDMIIAVAAGAAGAFGLSRPDVSDALPGVAISISLVPPLSVVGIAYSQADWAAGNGALLLFTTNMVAILVVGGLTFIATGVTPIQRAAENQHRVRTAVASVLTLAAVVFGALLLNGAEVASNALAQSTVHDSVEGWLDPFPLHRVVQIEQEDDTVIVTIVGPTSTAPSADTLATALRSDLGRSVTADLRLVVEERSVARSD